MIAAHPELVPIIVSVALQLHCMWCFIVFISDIFQTHLFLMSILL